ncbi:MAG: VOC family protein [Rhodospirillaceae bacterium]|nr:VOC family protein [Rhodospirillaceae bacterium]
MRPDMPNIQLSHLGICVENIARMEEFYTKVLGFTVTDRGSTLGLDLVFMSRDPRHHHEIVLSSGRPPGLGRNTITPVFGPVINQISFSLGTLSELQQMYRYLQAVHPGEYLCANHGVSWSIYFDDPEGNKIEIFVDTVWYITQPVLEPMDLMRPEAEILAETQALCAKGQNFQSIAAWREKIGMVMAG